MGECHNKTSAPMESRRPWLEEGRGYFDKNWFDGHQVPHNVEKLLLDENTDIDDTASS